MDHTQEELARLRLEQEFGVHAPEVLNAGDMPHVAPYALELRLQEAVPSRTQGWRPEYGDPDQFLQSLYHCQS